MTEFGGKTAVVTGAASGIGFAIASKLAAEGARVVLADVEQAALDDAVAALPGKPVWGMRVDVSDGESVRALAARVAAECGKVHVLVNNAGVAGEFGASWEATSGGWQWTLGVNLWGVIHGIQAFVPAMIEHGEEGHVVNTASAAAFLPIPFAAAYGASKAAVVSLSESLYCEFETIGSKLGVSVVCPAAVRTRIAESDRNRPDAPVREMTEQARAFLAGRKEAVKEAIAQGMDPGEVAEHVMRAIRERQLYVLTHQDVQPWIEKRTRNIVEGRNPKIRSMLDEG